MFSYIICFQRWKSTCTSLKSVFGASDLFVCVNNTFGQLTLLVMSDFHQTASQRLKTLSSPPYEPAPIWTLGLFLMFPKGGLCYRSRLLWCAPYAVSRAPGRPDDVMLSTQQRAVMISASAEPSKSPSSSSSSSSSFFWILVYCGDLRSAG